MGCEGGMRGEITRLLKRKVPCQNGMGWDFTPLLGEREREREREKRIIISAGWEW